MLCELRVKIEQYWIRVLVWKPCLTILLVYVFHLEPSYESMIQYYHIVKCIQQHG